MARWTLSGGLVLLIALSAAGHPSFVPVDPAIALVQADPGRTTFTLAMDSGGWIATLSRSVSKGCDVAAVVGSASPLSLRVRTLVLPSLFPLDIAIEMGWHRLAILGALHLGPVRLVADRTWGDDARVRIALHAADPRFVVTAGVEIGEKMRPFISTTWFASVAPLWSLSLIGTADGLRVAIGGTW